MITVYSAECFATKTRGRGTGFVAAATKVAGVAAPFFITTILSYGKMWQMSVVVSQHSISTSRCYSHTPTPLPLPPQALLYPTLP